MSKYVYFFGGERTEGNAGMKEELGGKGANLAEMASIGLPVPPGFTLSTKACAQYDEAGQRWPEGLEQEVDEALAQLEEAAGRRFGAGETPLLVSVRSGAAVSMPGMMDTVLNIGMNAGVLEAMSKAGLRRFALDAFRRLIQMFGDVVMKVDRQRFEDVLEEARISAGVQTDAALDEKSLETVVKTYRSVYRDATGEDFPEDPRVQLRRSIDAVFASWNNPRAVRYRQINDIRGLAGTAVNVQMMVFGNKSEACGTGVGFTRDPATGENRFYGEYLDFAQGEDVVAGIRTPKPFAFLAEADPKLFEQLSGIRDTLERHYKDMQDIEFTIEDGALYMLQTRNAKRTIFAHLRSAVEMVEEGLVEPGEAVRRVPARELGKLFAPVLDEKETEKARAGDLKIAAGLPASPGGASGRVVFTAEEAEAEVKEARRALEALRARKGLSEKERRAQAEALEVQAKVILCRIETSPEDVGGMHVAQGVLTARGGMTSHAAVVARGMGVPCVAGASGVSIDLAAGVLRAGGREIRRGAFIAIDGFDGSVYGTEIGVNPSEILQVLDGKRDASDSLLWRQYDAFMGWVDDLRRLGVRTNADKPADARRALQFGAEGIGLCRTEHMFFDNIVPFRRLILVADRVKRLKAQIAALGDKADAESASRRAALEEALRAPLAQYERALGELLPFQRRDFAGLFEAIEGRPATIRLLDPPLHEFLPKDPAGQEEMAREMGVEAGVVQETVEALEETNPMLGLRGCRLGLLYPEVSDMQVRAVVEAACEVKAAGKEARPEIMIPLVGKDTELQLARERAEAVVAAVLKEKGLTPKDVDVKIGTMIEVPRAAVTADRIAAHAEFFSFGTNDLTQMGCGFSRDDAGRFLNDYVEMGIYDQDPFKVLDRDGVGRLVKTAVDLGRTTRPEIKLGICGEHGGEPSSVAFCHEAGLDYVSCSPFRVPVARLAAAQAALAAGKR